MTNKAHHSKFTGYVPHVSFKMSLIVNVNTHKHTRLLKSNEERTTKLKAFVNFIITFFYGMFASHHKFVADLHNKIEFSFPFCQSDNKTSRIKKQKVEDVACAFLHIKVLQAIAMAKKYDKIT